MSAKVSESAAIRFGPFEFDPAGGELRKNGIRIRLQGKPAQMLVALVERPGRIVTREELRQRLWPDDTFVDFESSLNTAAKRLRDALGDSSDQPRYVETHHRTGYRFVAAVEPAGFPKPVVAAVAQRRKLPFPWMAAAAAVLLACGALLLFLLARRPPDAVNYQQLSFQKAPVTSARFGPDGKTVLYSAQVAPGRRQVFLTNGVSPESRALDNLAGNIVSVSSRGELALLNPSGTTPLAGSTLSRAPMNGGLPLELDRSVMSADWSPSGNELAVARAAGGAYRLEYPKGRVLFTTPGWLSHVRVSPAGDRVAFVHHPVRHDDSGSLMVASSGGETRVLVKDWAAMSGIAWHRVTGEIWFSGSQGNAARSLWAVSGTGDVRPVAQAPGGITIADISPGGSVLLARESRRLEMVVGGAGQPDREITWYDWSRIQEMSADGNSILFEESGDGAGGRPVSFLYKLGEAKAMRLGEGRAMGLTSDGKWALLLNDRDRGLLRLAPLGPGESRPIPRSGLTYQWARFLPGDRELLAQGNEPGKGLRLYRVPLDGKAPEAITEPTVVRNAAISPSGAEVAILDAGGRLVIHPIRGGAARVIPASEPLAPLLWTGRKLVVQHTVSYTEVPARVSILDLDTGAIIPWRLVGPADVTGVNAITRILVTEGLRHWAFNCRRVQGELFVASGLR